MTMAEPFSAEMAQRVEQLGFELVTLERAGHGRKPILRLAIDRPDSVAGQPGVSVEDCTLVSRALEPWLDERSDVADTYVLEVSSPGVERPLVRPRDWQRFAGAEVAVHAKSPLAAGSREVQGVLLGLRDEAAEPTAMLRLSGGDEIDVPLQQVDRANLVFRWGAKRRD